MGKEPSVNLFQDVHNKILLAKENLRKASETRTNARDKDAEKEAAHEGFDRPANSKD
jgi:hypothetical protein